MAARYKAVVWLFRLLLGTLVMHSACLAKDTNTVTDMAKRTVKVPQSPDRIICVAPGTLRLICYLGAQDKVVGVEQFEKRMRIGRPYWLDHYRHSDPIIRGFGAHFSPLQPSLSRYFTS